MNMLMKETENQNKLLSEGRRKEKKHSQERSITRKDIIPSVNFLNLHFNVKVFKTLKSKNKMLFILCLMFSIFENQML